MRNITTKLMILFISLTMSVTLLSASFSIAQNNNKLVLISPHQEGIRTEFEDAFIEWCRTNLNRDVKLEWLDVGGGTSTILRYIRNEFQLSPEGINIDLLFGGGTDIYLRLVESELLHPYKLPDEQLAKIPGELLGNRLYDPEYRWYGAAISAFGIIHNEVLRKRLRLPEVKSWTDLVNPKLMNRIGAADLRESGSAHMMYELILQAYGWEKGFQILTEIAGNVKTFPASSSQIPQDVATGRVIYGFAIDFYAYQQIVEVGADKLGYVIPSDTAVFTPDSIAILKGASNLELAEKFIDFVLSEEGQKLWMLAKGEPDGPKEFNLNRASVLPELYDKLGERNTVFTNPFTFESDFKHDFQKGGDRWVILNDLIGALIIDPHKKLVEAWKAINKSENKEAALKEFGKAPITEQEALELAKDKWSDSELKNRMKAEWDAFAREKYKKAKELAKG